MIQNSKNYHFVYEISDLLGYIQLESFPEEKIIRIENILPTKKVLSEKVNKIFLNILLVSTFMSFPSPVFASNRSQIIVKEKKISFKSKEKQQKKIIPVIEVNLFYWNTKTQNYSQNASILHGLLIQVLNQQNQIKTSLDFFNDYLPEKNVFYSPRKTPFLILKLNGNDPNFINQENRSYQKMNPEQLKQRLQNESSQKQKLKILFWLYFKFLLASIFIFFIIIILKKIMIEKSPLPLDGHYLSYDDIELLKPKGQGEEDLTEITGSPVISEELNKPNIVIRMREVIEYTFHLLKELQKDLICSEKPVRIKIYGKNGELVDARQTYYTFLLDKLDQYLNPEFFEMLQDLVIKIDSREDYLFNFSNQQVLIFMIKVFCQSIDYDDFECVIQLINHKNL